MDILPQELTTVAEIFRNNGFHTVGIQENQLISSQFGFNQGFDEYTFTKESDAINLLRFHLHHGTVTSQDYDTFDREMMSVFLQQSHHKLCP